MADLSEISDIMERLDGPSLIAFWGNAEPEDERHLEVREYDWHSHARGQLFCIDRGLVRMRTDSGSWLMPPNRLGWMPPGILHTASISGALSGWGVMLAPDVAVGLPDTPCVLGISELMRALVRRVAGWGSAEQLELEQERIAAVLLDEIRAAPHEPLHLPMPTDRRLLRIASHLLDMPDDARSFGVLAAWAGLTERTARRLFLAETGLSFAQWRQQARLTLALERLAAGSSVADVSEALGYATPSNFIAMFRRAFGDSPAHYFARKRP